LDVATGVDVGDGVETAAVALADGEIPGAYTEAVAFVELQPATIVTTATANSGRQRLVLIA
jgi:hypothetical protein